MNPVRAVLFVLAFAGCAAVYPELGTRTHPIPAGLPLDPAPPEDLHWIKFVSGHVPERTRDGRPWQSNGKASPYARFLVNDAELFRTSVEADTFAPTWPRSPKGNFKIEATDKIRIELWASTAVNDTPVGARDLGPAGELSVFEGQVRVEFDEPSADAVFAFQPAHAVSGLGLWYELRTAGCAISRLLDGSPAERAGLVAGDEVLKIGTRAVPSMSSDEVKSAFNAVPFDGLPIVVKHRTGAITEVTLKEGPIYPTFAQFGPMD